MKFYIKNLGNNKLNAFVECWYEYDWETVCEANIIIAGDSILIDSIKTLPKYRRKGIATFLINNLKEIFKEVYPIGIKNTIEAKSFWKKLNMEDVLGKEY